MVDEKINKTSSLGLTVSCCYNHQLNINEKILHVSRCNIEKGFRICQLYNIIIT